MAIGIGSIQHHHSYALLAGGFHDQVQGTDIGIEAHSDILDIEDEDINALQICGKGFLLIAVEGDDLHPGGDIDTVIDVHPGLGSSPKAMFGCKKGHDIDTTADQAIDQVGLADGAGMIDDQAYSHAF